MSDQYAEARAQAREQGEAVVARQQAAYDRTIKEGRALDPVAAFLRCFDCAREARVEPGEWVVPVNRNGRAAGEGPK